MKIKGLKDEDFVNYKKSSMFIIMPYCTWKCEKDCGIKCCQNGPLALAPIIDINTISLVDRYLANPITSAVVFGGLEPLDSFSDLQMFISLLRLRSKDDVVIYTGYNKDEIIDKLEILKLYENIIVKFGRYIPDQASRYDDVLGVTLASNNQYAEKI